MEYYNNNNNYGNGNIQQGGELTDSAVVSADDLGDYDSGGNYILLPEGDYDFTIVDLRESRHQDVGGKVGNCKQVNPVFRVKDPESGESVDISNYNLFMWNSRGCLSMIAQYYDSIGLHKKGDPIHFDWKKDHHIGKTGKLQIKHETYKKKDGSEGTSMKISRLYPQKATSSAPTNNWGSWKR